MTFTQIPFDVSLAIKAWRIPDKNGVVYWLLTKKGFPVMPTTYLADMRDEYPFAGRIISPLGKKADKNEFWTEDGKEDKFEPSDNDLVLIKVTV